MGPGEAERRRWHQEELNHCYRGTGSTWPGLAVVSRRCPLSEYGGQDKRVPDAEPDKCLINLLSK